jgi:SNF2 family DNA or RNA helicase
MIAKEVIEKFLTKVQPELPRFKGADPDELLGMIYGSTGAYYQEITKSRPHQLEGTAFALYMRRALLFYWMRLGKSKMALDWAAQLKRANLAKKKGLILAHAPMGAQVWLGQIETHSDLRAVLIKSGKNASDALIDACESDVDLIILSISTLQTLFTSKRLSRKGIPKLYPTFELLSMVGEYFDHAIIDEIHYYSAPYKLPFTLAAGIVEHANFRLGLTGTPIGRDAFKIWAQAYLIDDGKHLGRQYAFFEQVFGKKNYFSRTQFDLGFNKQLMPQLQYKIDALALSYGKDEVKSTEVYQGIVKLEMTKDQQTVYNQVVDGMLKLRLEDAVEIEASFMKLRMIASGYLPFNDDEGDKRVIHFSKSPKLEYIGELIEEIPKGTQCVIFHEFTHSGELICKTLAAHKASHTWIWGGAKDKQGELAKFKSGKAQFLVANTATGGTSIDLPEADYLCFFESPCSPIIRAQAQARPMARERPLIVDDLICAPIEDKIAGFLKEGNDLLRSLLSGKRKDLRKLLRAK